MSGTSDFFEETKNKIVKKTRELSSLTKLTVEIEGCKTRLSEAYKRIGEIIVNDTTSGKKTDEEIIVRYIDEARTEKQKLKELLKKRREVGEKVICPSCGKYNKKGTYCRYCGEFVR